MYSNSRIAWRVAHNCIFSQEEVLSMKAMISDVWSTGLIDDDYHDDRFRKAEIQGVNSLDNAIFTRLKKYVFAANQAIWKFDLTGYCESDRPHFVRYKRSGNYDWHIDHDSRSPTRKLTFVVQLSESDSYRGGGLEFFPTISTPSTESIGQMGSLIVFPVYYQLIQVMPANTFAHSCCSSPSKCVFLYVCIFI